MGVTREELRAYGDIRRQIRQLDEERAYWYSRAERCTRSPSKAPAYGSSDPYPFIMDKLAELGDLTRGKYAALVERRKRIEAAIDTLDDREQYLIRARYVEGRRWERIAVEMNYSWKQVHRIHGAALRKMTHYDTLSCGIV